MGVAEIKVKWLHLFNHQKLVSNLKLGKFSVKKIARTTILSKIKRFKEINIYKKDFNLKVGQFITKNGVDSAKHTIFKI